MKIKDLPNDAPLENTHFICGNDGKEYFWAGCWNKGVWGREQPHDKQIIPLLINNIDEALEWELVE
jgi:hypothetical protein